MGQPSKPAVYTIPPGYNFSRGLVGGIQKLYGANLHSLSALTLYVPNRRAIQAIQNSFLDIANGAPLILPALRPIGDVEEDEALFLQAEDIANDHMDIKNSISPMDRRLYLMRQIMVAAPKIGFGIITAAEALKLADELARLLDQMHIEGIDAERLNDLVPDSYAKHWQQTLKFLEIILEFWPRIKAQLDVLDPPERQKLLIEKLTDSLKSDMGERPIIAAGSTGTMPATAALLGTICRLKHGAIILPAYDPELGDSDWKNLDETHPQYSFKRLFERIGIHRDEVDYWPHLEPMNDTLKERVSLFRTAFWPTASVPEWQNIKSNKSNADVQKEALKNVSFIECSDIREEAGIIALAMRQALETDNKTASLITANRELAQRVNSELKRWGIEVDDSAGVPLSQTKPAGFIRLLLSALEDNFAPLSLLALLKHPLCSLASERVELLSHARIIERKLLRGARSFHTLNDLIQQIEANKSTRASAKLFKRVQTAIEPFQKILASPAPKLNDLLTTLLEALNLLTAKGDGGKALIWDGVEGQALSNFFLETFDSELSDLTIPSDEFAKFLEGLMQSKIVRRPYGGHPRLAIWGTLESRMQTSDLMIIGGLNEDSWPPKAAEDPWMSRPMRRTLGLPSTEFRVGLSAHDFFGALTANEAIITRSLKIDGAPTVPSRWLLRLKALLSLETSSKHVLKDWFHALDTPDRFEAIDPPLPRPPLESRPQKLSVTAVQRLIEDPYSIYARYILGLRPLDKINEEPQAATRGNIVHRALETFLKDIHDRPIVASDLDHLLACGEKAFDEFLKKSPVRAFWWPRFKQVAEAFIAEQISRADRASPAAIEKSGTLKIDVVGRPFTLTCEADRIDFIWAENHYSIIDYKTGSPPSAKRIQAGYAPQLPLEAVILEAGGFEGIKGTVGALEYWQVSGGANALKATTLSVDVREEITKARDNLVRLITCFNDANSAYLSKPNPIPEYMGYGEYDHIARVKEWIGKDRAESENG